MILLARPKLIVIDNALNPEQCEHLMHLGGAVMENSTVSKTPEQAEEEGTYEHEARTGQFGWLACDHDEQVWEIARSFSELVQYPVHHSEGFQILHYKPGERYEPHFDAYETETEEGQIYCKEGGQRMITLLGFLTDVDEGGATQFTNLDITIGPKQGRIIMWENCDEDITRPHPNTLHHGMPPISGDKWNFTLWFRERAMPNHSWVVRKLDSYGGIDQSEDSLGI